MTQLTYEYGQNCWQCDCKSSEFKISQEVHQTYWQIMEILCAMNEKLPNKKQVKKTNNSVNKNVISILRIYEFQAKT